MSNIMTVQISTLETSVTSVSTSAKFITTEYEVDKSVVSYRSDKTSISYNVNDGTKGTNQTGTINISGASIMVYNMLKVSTGSPMFARRVRVYYGEPNMQQLIFDGYINRAIYRRSTEGPELTLSISPDGGLVYKDVKTLSMPSPENTIQEVVAALNGLFGVEIIIDPTLVVPDSVGRFSCTGNLSKMLNTVLAKHKHTYIVTESGLIITSLDYSLGMVHTITAGMGLLSYPEEDTGKYVPGKITKKPEVRFTTRMNVRIKKNDIIQIPISPLGFSDIITGAFRRYKVLRTHTSFNGETGVTQVECTEVV